MMNPVSRGLQTQTAVAAVALALVGLPGQAFAEDVVLRALMEDVPETTIVEKMLPEFTEQTGIEVEFQKIGYPDMHDKLVPQLVSSNSYYNLLAVDFLWAGSFPAAGWLTDLTPYIEASGFDMEPFIPSMVDLLNPYDDGLYVLPKYNYSMGLLYRTDLMEDPALRAAYTAQTGKDLAPPATLADYVALSKFMKAEAGIAGAAMQAQRGDPNSMEFSNYLFSAGGAYLDNGTVVLDSPEARTALSLYIDNIKNGAQQGALSATLDDTMRLMCAGDAFSMVSYWWMLAQIDDPEACPAVAGKVGIAVMPGGHGESGGWGWGIPKNVSDAEKEAAWQFITWIQGKEASIARALDGHAPVRSDVFADPAVVAKYPYYDIAAQVVASGKAFPVFTYSAQYQNILGTQLSLAATGETSVDDAITTAAEGLEKLMAR
ncbi:extracellular solute-binding protein [Roseospira goensis]|uniref:ABC-type glycerol-3-phosphate transport system substrate-binding protein n=1 Tax=Roseospira goensis TaxID=391922 RepID=A0A7W6RZH1_9PROT|nr:extracellular solute-binding protein [Roseospira goensis]MBB4285911.1 ABC-type glycerol-3-phosphate transport system substrate-binding protein [Roseospira goensis]